MASHEQFTVFLQSVPEGMEQIDYTQPLRLIAQEHLRPDIEKNFALERTPGDAGWPPRKDDKPHPLLDETGKMYRAATKEEAEGNITEIGSQGLIIGIDGEVVDYAVFHMTGTSRMPSRRFFGASETARDNAAEILADHAEKEILMMFDRMESVGGADSGGPGGMGAVT